MADQVQGSQKWQIKCKAFQPLHPTPSSPSASRTTGPTIVTATRSSCPPVHAPAAQQPGQHVAHLNWSYFKPEFSGKPDEDAEAHLLHTND